MRSDQAASLQRDRTALLPHLATARCNVSESAGATFQVEIRIKTLNCEWSMAHKVAFKWDCDLRSAQQSLPYLFALPSGYHLYFKGRAPFKLISKSEFNEVTNMEVNS